MLFILLYAVFLFNGKPSASDCGSQRFRDCTSGFMSLDRIEAAVQGSSQSEDHVLGNLRSFPSEQDIDPTIKFTCNGSILSWTFAAQWDRNSRAYTELQVWRSSGDGSYTKVGSTTIMVEEESSTRLYQYTLTSPLPFQAEDILGWFQHSESAHLQYENVGSGHPLYYVIQNSPPSIFNIGSSFIFEGLHVLINVETDPAGYDCGFMSVERMNILLGLETVGERAFLGPRQQITPDIKLSCDGLITKWIIGADWVNRGNSYPELQVWRSIGNDVYHKINSTVLNITSQSPSRIYEYDIFSPIPVLAGDILGVLQPQVNRSKLVLWSELSSSGPLTYYLATDNTTNETSIDLPLSSQMYHPLVTLEMTTLIHPETVATPMVSTTQVILTTVASTTLPPHAAGGDEDIVNHVPFFVGVGVAGTLLVLITAAVIIVTVLVYMSEEEDKQSEYHR